MPEYTEPDSRRFHAAVRLEHYILFFGGTCQHRIAHSLHVIWMFNLYTEKWIKHVIPSTEMVPSSRYGACGVLVGSDVYMFGGRKLPHLRETNALWKLAKNQQASFVWNKIVISDLTKSPSPRIYHTGWEHAGKLWVFGGKGISPANYLNNHGDYFNNLNNQLLCFNSSSQEWTNMKCSGSVPTPCARHATTIVRDKVWLCGANSGRPGVSDILYELDMWSLTWTQIQTFHPKPQRRYFCSFNAISGCQIVLHGGERTCDVDELKVTWILDPGP